MILTYFTKFGNSKKTILQTGLSNTENGKVLDGSYVIGKK